jgi:peroxiredoxin
MEDCAPTIACGLRSIRNPQALNIQRALRIEDCGASTQSKQTSKGHAMNLQAELDAAARSVQEQAPAQVITTFETAYEKLAASGLKNRALQPGQSIGDFELPDATGDMVRSADLRANGPLLLIFYRGEWCPFCNLQLKAFAGHYSEISRKGVTLVAISPQTPDNSLTMRQKHNLRFPVLSDSGNKVARQFGIVYQVEESLKQTYQMFGVDLSARNGDTSFELPVPAAFLVDKSGKVLQSQIEIDHMKRFTPETALTWLDKL